MKTRSDEASEPCGGVRPATWLQTSCGVQNSRRQISARVSHNWGSSRMLVRRPRTLILRITSALCLSGSPSGAVRRLGRAVAMGAIRTCVAAPDSQPWKAHYKPRVVNIRCASAYACNLWKKLALLFCEPYADTHGRLPADHDRRHADLRFPKAPTLSPADQRALPILAVKGLR